MIDAAVRLLSLVNQLDATTKMVQLDFQDGDSGLHGYLDRMGFFDHLAPDVDVKPYRPEVSRATLHRGRNAGLVEIARINKDSRDDDLPKRMANVIARACQDRTDVGSLTEAAWTVFAELVDNVFSHSQTRLDAFAALQVYRAGNKLSVAVSDSGLGILETLRPALEREHPVLHRLTDVDLLVEIFRQGVSRYGKDRGCGLKGSAAKAIKYRADLDIRLPEIRVLLSPGHGGYSVAHCFSELPLLWGTHLSFAFRLDH
ncbi:MAG: hypothetical protein OXG83_14955 [Acidobacteria bacterium]|nr:hypothetical protein [Acidobacteriota bacterium]